MRSKLLYSLLALVVAFAFCQSASAQSIAKGFYFIKSAYTYTDGNQCVYDNGTDEVLKIRKCTNAKEEIFLIDEYDDGKYSVQNASTGRYVIKFTGTNSVTLGASTEDGVYQVFDKAADGIWNWKDNFLSTYYNWNGSSVNGGAPFSDKYNYHDWKLEAVSSALLQSLGIDESQFGGSKDSTIVNPQDSTIVGPKDSTQVDTLTDPVEEFLQSPVVIPGWSADEPPAIANQLVPAGYYRIYSAYQSGYVQKDACMYDEKSGHVVKIHSSDASREEIFYVYPVSNGEYVIKNFATGRYMGRFLKTNAVALLAGRDESVTHKIEIQSNYNFHIKDNAYANYYNWNGDYVNAAPLSATYNYHDWSFRPVSIAEMAGYGVTLDSLPAIPTKPEADDAPVKDGFYFVRSAYNSPYVTGDVVWYDSQDEGVIKNHTLGYEKIDIFLIKNIGDRKYTMQNLGTGRYVQMFEATNSITMGATPPDGVWIEFKEAEVGIYRIKDSNITTFYNWNGNSVNAGAGLSAQYNYHDWNLVPVDKSLLESFGVTGDSIPPIEIPKDSVAYIDAAWMSLGTSITWYNNNVSSAFTKGYQTRVREELPFKRFFNRGVNASCLAGTENQVAYANYYTIEHGINDWGHCTPVGTIDDYKNNTNNGTFAASYRKVIDKIYATNPKAQIVLCTPRKAYGFNGYLPANCEDAHGGIYLHEYADLIREIAEYESLPVADFFALCGNQRNLASLSIDQALHPNDRGYQLMADVLVKAMKKILIHPIVNPVEGLDF